MHYVDRGPEPRRLSAVRQRETPRWVAYVEKRRKTKPSVKPWRAFEPDLRAVFYGLCGYCEEICRGGIDHFRPKSKFPERVYRWANWVYSCHACNQLKSNKWPRGGFVDPCATATAQHPEEFFEFDTLTGEILPKKGLSRSRHDKAERTIRELHLNGISHRRKRGQRVFVLSTVVSGMAPSNLVRQEFLRLCARRSESLSSITRAFLEEAGCSLED